MNAWASPGGQGEPVGSRDSSVLDSRRQPRHGRAGNLPNALLPVATPRHSTGDRLATGGVLYDGEATVSFGSGLFAVPLRSLWTTP